MGAAPACKRTRGVSVAVAAAITLLSLTFTGAAATKATSVWGVQLQVKKLPSASELAKLHKQGLTALVIDPAGVTPAQRSRLATSARRAGLVLLLPRRSAPAGLARTCRAARSSSSRNCAILATSPKAAVALARRNVADYVVLRLSTLGQLRFLKGVKANTRILAVATPSTRTLNRTLWSRAIASAAKDPTLDLAIAVASPGQANVRTYSTLVRTAGRGNVKTTLATPDAAGPDTPTGLSVQQVTATSVRLNWASNSVGVAGYGVYRNGILSYNVATPGITLDSLACGTTYTFSIDAYDAADNRSARASIAVSTAVCSGGSGSGGGGCAVPLRSARTGGDVGLSVEHHPGLERVDRQRRRVRLRRLPERNARHLDGAPHRDRLRPRVRVELRAGGRCVRRSW